MNEQTYSKPLFLAIILHVVLLAFLMFELTFPSASSPSASQPVIQAVAVSQSVIDNYNQAVAQIQQEKIAQQMAIQKQIEQQKQAQIQKQLAIQKQIQLQKLQAQKLAEQQAQAAKAAAEKAQQQKIAQQKAVKEAQMKKALQQQLKADIQKQLTSDMPHSGNISSNASVKQSTPAPSQNNGELDKYKALIIQSISQQWIVPENLPKNISCELDVSVAPGGVVLKVSVIKSSGNPVLDNSAVAAVNKASPLPVPTDAALFNQFRELHLTVKPDGSMVEA